MNIRLKWIAALGLAAVVAVTVYKNLNQPMGEMAQLQITTMKQEKIDFAQLQQAGKVTVVNFWATTCTTCKKEMPHMVEMYNQFKPKGLEYVGVAMQYDNPEHIQNYVADQGLPFYIAWDVDGRLSNQFGNIMGTPTTFIVDKKGNIIKRYVGEPKWDEFYDAINHALAA